MTKTKASRRKRTAPKRRPKPPARKAARAVAGRRTRRARRAASSRPRRRATQAAPRVKTPTKAPTPRTKAAGLQRERRRLSEPERLNPAKDLGGDRMMAAARSGHDELKAALQRHTETSPTLTAGDVDARWQDAYAVGDEAPGGDNPTPDQDRVDDIGKALGVQYQDDEELKGGDEIAQRDQKRWELDPASSDDWPHKK